MPSRHTLANAIRVLAIDAVQKANSGHPGMPMGMADIATVLWQDFLKHNPANPNWINRDRFIISNGHGAMLHYALLHLSGYDLSLDDLKSFRQLHSKTPGHPEYGYTAGVETTTGPLGQGLANGVGMAIAEKLLATQFNKPSLELIDHFTYVFVGDGCLMEGISHEACSLAGTLGLGKLIVLWDDNGISIDGEVKNWFGDNTPQRFESYHWHVVPNVDGHDPAALQAALAAARAATDKPSLICCRTQIGYGSPNKANTADVHGSPLGHDEIALVRHQLGWSDEPFVIPESIYAAWDARPTGKTAEEAWQTLFNTYQTQFPNLAKELMRRVNGELPQNFLSQMAAWIQELQTQAKPMATRKSSQLVLNKVSPDLPELLGGSADLTASNCTDWSGSKWINHDNWQANYLSYGVREFAMSAIMNGIALYKGFIPYGGTFLTFSDYARNAVRLSALMQQHVIYVYSHESIGLGEDGPTHQPIEHTAMLRMTPGLRVWRPCDTVETAVAWEQALALKVPSCLLLTRQNVAPQQRDARQVSQIQRGAYVLVEPKLTPEVIIMATGSEVDLAVKAAAQLNAAGQNIRVVSMPCCEIFKQQSAEYRVQVLPAAITKRVAIEAGVSDYWYQFVGLEGAVIGIDHFGASAPAEILFKEFGFTVENVVKVVSDLL